MKSFIKLFTIVMASLILVSCGSKSKDAEATTQSEQTEIALVTDTGSIDDRSFNQSSWEAIKEFAEENGKTYKYYKPEEQSDNSVIATLELAIKGGAKAVICPSYLFQRPIHELQNKYPDVAFVIIDSTAVDENGNEDVAPNVKGILYKEEQAGFLAGYAVVKDGYRNLGFMGGIAIPPVARYGAGFILGADQAAKELGLAKGDVNIRYTYLGNFDASPDNTAKASSWYSEGVDVIFAAAGFASNSIIKASESFDGKKVIGVDVDQSSESENVITSAMKNVKQNVAKELQDIFSGTFEGGHSVSLGVDNGSVLLPIGTSRFKNFSVEDYNEIYQNLYDGAIEVNVDENIDDVTTLPTEVVNITLS